MLMLTSKARQTIDTAVRTLPDEQIRAAWVSWAKENPQIRRPDGPTYDYSPDPEQPVVAAVLAALERVERSMRERINEPFVSEDEVSDLENDLTYVVGLTRLWRENFLR
jgi:hypothetical protein